MAVPAEGKHKRYARYAAHCLRLLRYSAGKCLCTSARTSSSVDSVMTLGMTIGRGSGRRQLW